MIRRTGVPLVVSAPSGAGKTTMCHNLQQLLGDVEFSISHTTRPRRGTEQDGVDYHFVDDATFDRMIRKGAFLEWAHVHDRRYGTARGPVTDRLGRGIDVLFDIDVQGGRQIAERLPDAVLVFVLPPSMEVLERRLRGRESDSEEQITRRLAVAKQEMTEGRFYTYWIVNDDLQRAVADLRAVIVAERLRRVDGEALVRLITEGE